MLPTTVVSYKFLRTALQLAIPVALQQTLLASQGAMDVLMISQLGETSLAGAGLGTRVHFTVQLIMSGLAIASATYIAQYAGQENKRAIQDVIAKSMTLGIVFAISLCIILVSFSERIASFGDSNITVINTASSYINILSIACVPTQLILILELSMRAQHKLKTATLIAIICALINCALNYFLIYGIGPVPMMGSDGAALATLISRLIQCYLLFYYCLKIQLINKNTIYSILFFKVKSGPSYLEISHVATPIIFNLFSWSLGALCLHFIAGKINTTALAIASFMAPVETVCTALFVGLASACSVLCGNYLGANLNRQATQSSFFCLTLAIITSLIISMSIFLNINILEKIKGSPEYITLLKNTLSIYATGLFIRASTIVIINGTLRSGADNKFCTILDTTCMWAIEIPLACILAFWLKFDYSYVYGSFIVSESIKFAISFHRIKTNRWQKNLTKNQK